MEELAALRTERTHLFVGALLAREETTTAETGHVVLLFGDGERAEAHLVAADDRLLLRGDAHRSRHRHPGEDLAPRARHGRDAAGRPPPRRAVRDERAAGRLRGMADALTTHPCAGRLHRDAEASEVP